MKLGTFLRLDLNRMPVDPSVSYPIVGVLSFGRGLLERKPIENGKTSFRMFNRLKAEHVVMSQLFGGKVGRRSATRSLLPGFCPHNFQQKSSVHTHWNESRLIRVALNRD